MRMRTGSGTWTLKDPRKSTLLAKVNRCSEKGSCGEEMRMTLSMKCWTMQNFLCLSEVYQDAVAGTKHKCT